MARTQDVQKRPTKTTIAISRLKTGKPNEPFMHSQSWWKTIATMTTLPIISLTSPTITQEITTACSTDGAFILINHGIDSTLLDAVLTTGKSFFSLPQEIKNELSLTNHGPSWRGYMPRGGERSHSGSTEDAKEGFYMGNESDAVGLFSGPNVFPDESVVPGMKEVFLRYNAEMKRLGDRMMRVLSIGLDLPEETIEEHVTESNPMIFPRMFNYFPSTSENEWGIGEHSDYGLWTMILTDAPGLEFQHPKSKEWHAVPFVKHGIVMNVGDLLDRISCGRFVSPYHRVRNQSTDCRISLPFFYHPSWTFWMKALPVTDEHLYDMEERRERWSKMKLDFEFDGSMQYSEFLTKKVANVFPGFVSEQATCTSEASTRHALVVDTPEVIITKLVLQNVEAFYQHHTEIKESHGIQHIMAVYNHALKAVRVHNPPLSSTESMQVQLAALLHDIDDRKYFPQHVNYENARDIMTSAGVGKNTQSNVIEMISYVSCSKNKNNVPTTVSEKNAYWKLIPRWADRLEAIGRIGVIRCYQYNREIGEALSSENSPCPKSIAEVWEFAKPERFEAYDGNSTDMISHYYDKLLHIARPPSSIVKNSYLEKAAVESSKELVEVCLRYGRTGKVDEDYIKSLKA